MEPREVPSLMVEGEAAHQLHTQLLFLPPSNTAHSQAMVVAMVRALNGPMAVSLWTMRTPQHVVEIPSRYKERQLCPLGHAGQVTPRCMASCSICIIATRAETCCCSASAAHTACTICTLTGTVASVGKSWQHPMLQCWRSVPSVLGISPRVHTVLPLASRRHRRLALTLHPLPHHLGEG
jgi:hypothetical protein